MVAGRRAPRPNLRDKHDRVLTGLAALRPSPTSRPQGAQTDQYHSTDSKRPGAVVSSNRANDPPLKGNRIVSSIAATTDRATGPAIKRTTQAFNQATLWGQIPQAAISETIQAWRRAGHRGSATRRPSARQIRSLLKFAAGSAA